MTGLDPMPRTLRELAWASRGRQMLEWNHTSEILAAIANLFSVTGERVTAAQINPFGAPAAVGPGDVSPEEASQGWDVLRSLTLKGQVK